MEMQELNNLAKFICNEIQNGVVGPADQPEMINALANLVQAMFGLNCLFNMTKSEKSGR